VHFRETGTSLAEEASPLHSKKFKQKILENGLKDVQIALFFCC